MRFVSVLPHMGVVLSELFYQTFSIDYTKRELQVSKISQVPKTSSMLTTNLSNCNGPIGPHH